MKEFEKWKTIHSPGEYAYQKWEEVWRAALEWVLKDVEEHYSGRYTINIEDIEEELEN